MSAKQKIAFLGIGLMGYPMARNILQAGFALTAWNRSANKAKQLEAFGGKIATDPATAVAEADIIVTMVSDGLSVADLLFAQGVSAAMKNGAIFIDMSSIKPSEARDHAARLFALGIDALDAPVSGGTKGADSATLAIMAGGDKAAFVKAEPVFKAMGRPTWVGPSGSGQIAKLANQGIVAVTIGAVAEAILLSEKAGLEKGALRQALAGGFADSVILQQHGGRMENRNFVPGGKAAFQLKDLNNLLNSADDLHLDLPIVSLLRERFAYLVNELNGAELDHAALWIELNSRQKTL